MGQAVAGKLNADRSDEQGPHLPCPCGGEARLAGRRPKTFTTALGLLTLKRAWYHCDQCHHGFSPRDRALGMEDTGLSPAALRMLGIAAARTSFAGASALLRELAGLAVSPKTVERHAEALGREVARDESRVIDPEPCEARTLYLGLDGTGVPARKSEVEGRAGKQPDASAKTREAKLAVVWSADTTDKKGHPVRDPGSTTYNAAIETIATRDTETEPAPFAKRIRREAQRRGFATAPRRVVLGDGAPWIWNFTDEHFPDAVQIVDLFHAKGHLFEVAKAIYGPGSEVGEQWAKKRREELDEGRVDDVIGALRSHARAPHLFAGLHEATALPCAPWRCRIKSGAACGPILPEFAVCSTARLIKASPASDNSPTASVMHSTCATAAAGGSAQAAARRWACSRHGATSRCLRPDITAPGDTARGCSPMQWCRHTMCRARSGRCASLRWCASRPTRNAWCGTP